MENKIIPKSYVKQYWFIWLSIVTCFLILRFLVFSNSENEDIIFTLFNFYAIPTWICIMILNFFEGYRLRTYLEENHHKIWEYQTSGPGFGSGGVNSFRTLPFVYSNDDLSDPMVKELKLNYRRFVRFMLTVFFTLPVLFISMMLPLGS